MDQLDNLRSVPTIALFWMVASMALPFVVATINRTAWSSFLKWCVTATACLVASAGYFLITEEGFAGWTWRNWLTFGFWIILGATIFYKLFGNAVREVEVKTG